MNLTKEEIESISKQLSDSIMGRLMMKSIRPGNYNSYKEIVYEIIYKYFSNRIK